MTSHVWQSVRAPGLDRMVTAAAALWGRFECACAHLLVIWQEVIGCNDVLVELLDDAVPVDAGLACIPRTSPP